MLCRSFLGQGNDFTGEETNAAIKSAMPNSSTFAAEWASIVRNDVAKLTATTSSNVGMKVEEGRSPRSPTQLVADQQTVVAFYLENELFRYEAGREVALGIFGQRLAPGTSYYDCYQEGLKQAAEIAPPFFQGKDVVISHNKDFVKAGEYYR